MKTLKFFAPVMAVCLIIAGCNLQEGSFETGGYSEQSSSGVSDDTLNQNDSNWEELLTYEEYLAMSAQERTAFADSFEDSSEFFQWLKSVKAIYEQAREDSELGQEGIIDMDEIDPKG